MNVPPRPGYFRYLLAVACMLLVRQAALPAASAQDTADRMHVILVCDAWAQNIGQNMVVNQQKLAEVIGEVFAERPEKLGEFVAFAPEQVNPQFIIQYIRSLQVVPGRDAILFYYCGHGGWDARDNGVDGGELGHYLATSGGVLYRSALREALLAKQAYSVALITDCCSNIAGIEPPHRRIPAEWEGFRDLFFRQRGLVDIQATTRGHFGWSNREGGLFTCVLVKLLCQPRAELRYDGSDGFVSWSDFFSRLQSETVELFVQTQARATPRTDGEPDILDYQPQTPEAFYLAEWPAYERYIRVSNNTGERLCLAIAYLSHTPELGWQWYGGDSLVYEIEAGQDAYLRNGVPVHAARIRFRAWTPTRRWEYGGADYLLVPADGYRAGGELGTYTLNFQ